MDAKELVVGLRWYALRTAHRKILITSNGLFPDVDFNSVGMYPWNPDEQTPDYRGADYVVDAPENGPQRAPACCPDTRQSFFRCRPMSSCCAAFRTRCSHSAF